MLGAVAPPPAVVLDLDGVVWLGDEPIDGAAAAVARLREAGVDVVFVTNNAHPTVADIEAKLVDHGIDGGGAVFNSPMAAATLVARGERALVLGGPGVIEAVLGRGAVPVSPAEADAPDAAPVDVVVVGFHRSFDWERMRVAATAIRGGARFVATNDDATYPTAAAPVPGGGAIVAGVATAAGVTPTVAGKPHQALADLVLARCGPVGVMVGDRLDTDGGFAVTLGWPFALVLSGVTTSADLPVSPTPDLVAADLQAVVDDLLGPSAAAGPPA